MDNSRALKPPAPLAAPEHAHKKFTDAPWWPWLKRGATVAFFALVAFLLFTQARSIDWQEVLSSLRHYPVASVWSAVLLVVVSFTLYSTFDLLGRHYTGHTLGTPTVMAVTFTTYAFNLNLGSLVGGVAFRYRLYSRLGLDTGTITRVMSLSMLTNWMGYVLLAGLIFSLQPPTLPEGWKIATEHLRYIGFVLVAIAAAYLAVCGFSRKRTLQWRGHAIALPSLRLAGLQLLMGAANWLVMSCIIFILLQHRVEFSAVVSVLLLAAVAGVITHVPAGLGVLEAVFVALLSHVVAKHDILAALVAYRVIYYLAPLAAATALYLVTEARARKIAQAT